MKHKTILLMALLGLLPPTFSRAQFISSPCSLVASPQPGSWCVDSNKLLPQVFNGTNRKSWVRSLNPRGAWSYTATYSAMDSITSKGSTYLSLSSRNINHAPSSNPDHWGRLAAVAATGVTAPTRPGGLAVVIGRTTRSAALVRTVRVTSAVGTINGVINVKDSPYGALGNNTGDDQPAIQAAYNAACAAIQVYPPAFSAPSVYLPAGIYRTLAPLTFNCLYATPRVYGAGRESTIINAMFVGPAVVGSSAKTFPSYNNVTVTSNIIPGGSGSSMNYGAIGVTGFQDLNETLGLNTRGGGNPHGPFNGLSAWDFQGHITVADTSSVHCLWASDGGLNTGYGGGTVVLSGPTSSLAAPVGIMGFLCTGTDAKLYGALNIGGTMHSINSGRTRITSGKEYEVELNYDNANGQMNLYLGNGTVGRVAQLTGLSGTIIQRPDENNVIGGDLATWPYSNFGSVWHGSFQSLRISNAARNTAANYREDTGGYSRDGHTLWLEKLSQSEFPGNAPVLEVEAGMGFGPWWQTWHDNGSGCCTGTLQMTDLAITGQDTIGVMGDAELIDVDNVAVIGSLIGIYTSNNSSFFSKISNSNIGNAELTPLMMMGGINKATHVGLGVGAYNAVLSGNSIYDHFFFETNAYSVCGIAFVGGGVIDARLIDFDSENEGSFPGFCISNFNSPITISESSFSTVGPLGAPVKLYGVVGKIMLDGNEIHFPRSAGPTAIVDASSASLDDGGATPGISRVIFKNNTYNGSAALPFGVSYTNNGLQFDPDDGPTQFANLQMPVLPNIVNYRDTSCLSSPCSVAMPPNPQVGRVEVALTNLGEHSYVIVPPAGWRLGVSATGRTCTANDHSGPSQSNFAVYWHVNGPNDGPTTSWSFSRSDNLNCPIDVVELAGANQLDPIGLCAESKQEASSSRFAALGGVSDINALAILMVKNRTLHQPAFLSPPTGFYDYDQVANGQHYHAYLPRSTTVPRISMSNPTPTSWGALQITILPDRIQTGLMPFNAGSPPCWYGESGCSLSGLFIAGPAPVISSCGGTTAPTKGSTNSFGEVTGGGGAKACTVTFANGGFPNFAACSLTDETTAKGLTLSSLSKRGFTTSNITAGDKFTYACGGN